MAEKIMITLRREDADILMLTLGFAAGAAVDRFRGKEAEDWVKRILALADRIGPQLSPDYQPYTIEGKVNPHKWPPLRQENE